ncbi:MAG: hypothetical protein J6T13_09180 [Bacteroidales bacterium]|nr:hypothetical protein [Bacteroidales bacterium]MCR4857483.1 hypothetical protein [Bacteroidales bacterium]
MKKALLLIISIVALGLSYAQERPSFIHRQCDHFTVDIQENVYIWKDATLEKYDPDGNLMSNYSNYELGDICNVDASIPSKILVFHKEASVITILDNTLSPVGNRLSLFEHNLFSVTLAAFAGANRIALFDNSTHQLILTDLSLNIASTTPVNFGEQFNPTSMAIALDKSIVLIDTTYGLFFFDNFGTFERKILLPNILAAQWQGNFFVYLKDGKLQKYDIFAMDSILIADGLADITEFRLTNKKLFLLGLDGRIQCRPIVRR